MREYALRSRRPPRLLRASPQKNLPSHVQMSAAAAASASSSSFSAKRAKASQDLRPVSAQDAAGLYQDAHDPVALAAGVFVPWPMDGLGPWDDGEAAQVEAAPAS